MKLKKNTKRYSKLIMLSVLTVLLVGCTQTSERKVVDRLVKKYNPENFAGDEEKQKKALSKIDLINKAYQYFEQQDTNEEEE